MSACNKFKESIIHLACRRAEFSIVQMILTHGGDVTIMDDFGRSVLHDTCWRPDPRFDIATLILDQHLEMVFYLDSRGCSPLQYVPQGLWIQWCAYLFHQKDKYWPRKEGQSATHAGDHRVHVVKEKRSRCDSGSDTSSSCCEGLKRFRLTNEGESDEDTVAL